MALTARYTKPLQIVATPEMAQRTKAIADREGISLAEVYRQLIAAGLPEREAWSENQFRESPTL